MAGGVGPRLSGAMARGRHNRIGLAEPGYRSAWRPDLSLPCHWNSREKKSCHRLDCGLLIEVRGIPTGRRCRIKPQIDAAMRIV
jgi:hypothetical protein